MAEQLFLGFTSLGFDLNGSLNWGLGDLKCFKKELIFISLITRVKIRWGFNDPCVGKHNCCSSREKGSLEVWTTKTEPCFIKTNICKDYSLRLNHTTDSINANNTQYNHNGINVKLIKRPLHFMPVITLFSAVELSIHHKDKQDYLYLVALIPIYKWHF